MFAFNSWPLAFAALSLGLMFGLTNIGIARNPEMEQQLFTNVLIGFALIETFVFMNIGISVAVFALV